MLSGAPEALLAAFGIVFLAELGDKTQLMVLAFAARYRVLPVLIGVVVASALVMGASVLLGAWLGAVIDLTLLQLAGALVFLVSAAWTVLVPDDDPEEAQAVAQSAPPSRLVLRSVAIVVVTFLLAELGDKSMLAAMALAIQAEPAATWLGATLGLVTVSLIAVAVGRQLGPRLPRKWLRFVSAAAFAAFGLLLLVSALA
ncbi:MAG TPA: TMEM165/GDT1 family protein [Candidatus Limnocylindria bacterium]|nr:TMEM165/GDT1 family protein [Candidatus Limnocylindria bacterium]